VKNLIIGSLVAAVAMFVWGFVFWVLSGIPRGALKSAPDVPAAQAALASAFPESGAYFVPDDSIPQEEYARLHEAGPIAFVHYRAEGAPPMDPGVLLSGFLHNWVTCLLLGWLLLQSRTPTFVSRVAFVTIAGITASLFIDYGAVIWFYADRSFQLVNMFSNVSSWLAAGIVLAWKPGSGAAAW
jgi:hypothetical protein